MNKLSNISSTGLKILIGLGLFILGLFITFAVFTLGYWLITLVLMTFFSFFLPFSWWYSLGAWLILLIVSIFIAPGLFAVKKNDN